MHIIDIIISIVIIGILFVIVFVTRLSNTGCNHCKKRGCHACSHQNLYESYKKDHPKIKK